MLAVLCLVRLRAIATNLGCIALSGDVAVVIATEALHHSAGAVIEFALVYLAFPRHSSIYYGVGDSGSVNSTTIEDARLSAASLVSHPMYDTSALGITV